MEEWVEVGEQWNASLRCLVSSMVEILIDLKIAFTQCILVCQHVIVITCLSLSFAWLIICKLYIIGRITFFNHILSEQCSAENHLNKDGKITIFFVDELHSICWTYQWQKTATRQIFLIFLHVINDLQSVFNASFHCEKFWWCSVVSRCIGTFHNWSYQFVEDFIISLFSCRVYKNHKFVGLHEGWK